MSYLADSTFVLCAIAIDTNGDIILLSEANDRTRFAINGYYSEKYLLGTHYYRMEDFTGEVNSKEEDSIAVNADIRIEDSQGGISIFHKECCGYTGMFEDCYMLLIVSLGDDAESTTVDFQNVDKIEVEEAVGKDRLLNWMRKHQGKNVKAYIDGPTF